MKLIIDGNELLMKAIFIWRKSKKIPIEYFIFLQLIKFIKIFQPDDIYITADGGHSWRKDIYNLYKHRRKELRQHYRDIPWDVLFKRYDKLLDNLNKYSRIKVVKIFNLEGDDVISALCHIYKDSNKIVVSQDKDLAQLVLLKNTQVYSTRTKKFRTIKEAEMLLKNKISKGDSSDDIPKATSLSELIRNQILIDLVHIPTSIIDTVKRQLSFECKRQKKTINLIDIYNYKIVKKNIELLCLST